MITMVQDQCFWSDVTILTHQLQLLVRFNLFEVPIYTVNVSRGNPCILISSLGNCGFHFEDSVGTLHPISAFAWLAGLYQIHVIPRTGDQESRRFQQQCISHRSPTETDQTCRAGQCRGKLDHRRPITFLSLLSLSG